MWPKNIHSCNLAVMRSTIHSTFQHYNVALLLNILQQSPAEHSVRQIEPPWTTTFPHCSAILRSTTFQHYISALHYRTPRLDRSIVLPEVKTHLHSFFPIDSLGLDLALGYLGARNGYLVQDGLLATFFKSMLQFFKTTLVRQELNKTNFINSLSVKARLT